jgi:dipeptidase E
VPPARANLFLGSQGLGALGAWFDELPRRPVRATLIPTGSNRYPEAPWVGHAERTLDQLRLTVERFDLEGASVDSVERVLAASDLVFVTGGDISLLLGEAKRTGFYELVPEHVRTGHLAYAGMSTGGFLAGPDLLSVPGPSTGEPAQDTRGLGIAPVIPLSHANRNRKDEHQALIARFGSRYRLVPITDEQAIVVADDHWEVRSSPIGT